MFDNQSAIDYYKMNFNLIKSNIVKVSLTEIDDMIPFERDIYVNLYHEEINRLESIKNNG